MKPGFVRIPGADLERASLEVKKFADQMGILAGGVLLEKKAIAVTATTIAHRLGSVPTGWVAHSLTADARIWQSQVPDATNIYLIASAVVTANLWVY